MPCDEYKRQKDIAKGHRQQANYLRFNGPFAGKRKTREMIAREDRLASEAERMCGNHLRYCDDCLKFEETAGSRPA